MSIDLVADAGCALAGVIEQVKRAGHREEPAVLMRIGALDARIAAARALAAYGDTASAALLAAQAVRSLARDFPAADLPSLDLVAEQHAYRRIGADLLSASAVA